MGGAIALKKIKSIVLLVVIAIASLITSTKAYAAEPIRLVVNGRDITHMSAPILDNNRTLVPVRFVAEELGGKVGWDNTNRAVSIEKDGKKIVLIVGSRLIQLDNGARAMVSDVAPKIINDRTYVPLRVISNALNIGIDWKNEIRTVYVDSSKTSTMEPFFNMRITSPAAGIVITGTTEVSYSIGAQELSKGNELRLMLLDNTNAKGFVVARGTGSSGKVTYIPKVEDNGSKLLAAALYNSNGILIASDVIPATVQVMPQVSIGGIYDNMTVSSAIQMTPQLNFVPHSVTYTMTNLNNGNVLEYKELDPYGTFTWDPSFEQQGTYNVKLTAYDMSMNGYDSRSIQLSVSLDKKLSLSGVTQGMTVNKPVTLIASRNFNVKDTTYVLRDKATGAEIALATIPYGGYTWFPGPQYSGDKELMVRVTDTLGQSWTSNPISVKVDGSPRIQFLGIGPNEVITGASKLNYRSNVDVTNIKYVLTNIKTGEKRTILPSAGFAEAPYAPLPTDTGDWRIQVEGSFNGSALRSESVQYKVYTGKLYGPYRIIEKDKFLGFASGMAVEAMKKTGMSAAIQTAQAILETGWGQSVPSDKYTGKKSNNLFGIKQKGNEDYVISNTWEVYNGVTYRIDAKFRAYKDPKESWNDHKALLLNAARYQIFRDVMHDYTSGAWAIRRAGYATDPQYPLKLIRLVNQYNLQELDRIIF